MAKTLGVGIIGASAERGWAKLAHVPAVQKLDGLNLAAVASGNQAKADTAAKAFGANAGYADGNRRVKTGQRSTLLRAILHRPAAMNFLHLEVPSRPRNAPRFQLQVKC